MDSGRGRASWIFTLAVIIGGLVAGAVDLVLFMYDDSCPQWEDEGTMAAPGSLYSQVMCAPGTEPPFTWAVVIGTVVAALLAVLLVRRGPVARVTSRLGWALVLMLVPALMVGLLHLTLPQDCLSGRTESGDCGRDRELR
jgi:membrane protease YdiL (CAAX protease family)